MRCPKCGKQLEFVYATQIVHVDVKVDEDGAYIDNKEDGDLYDSAYAFEDPCGDYCCPECGEYFQDISAFWGN